MAKASRNLRIDRDGVRVFESAGAKRFDARILIAVVAVAAIGAAVLYLKGAEAEPPSTARATERQSEPARQEPEASAVAEAAQAPVRPRSFRAVHVDPAAPAQQEAAAGEPNAKPKDQSNVDARDVIMALKAAGETEGIAAFNPPGTNPPKSGILVPEDFDLPEGYVRHYQATDDGERLAAILMFSPDYQFVDAAGNPISLPEDLIVPPDLAPPGLPIRWLEIPKRSLR